MSEQSDRPPERPLSRMQTASYILERHHAFILAIVIIVAFLVFYALALDERQVNGEHRGVERVTSTLGPIVASIIGFYFGQRPIRAIARNAEEARGQRDLFKREFADLVDHIGVDQTDIAKYTKEMESMRTEIGNIKKQLGL